MSESVRTPFNSTAGNRVKIGIEIVGGNWSSEELVRASCGTTEVGNARVVGGSESERGGADWMDWTSIDIVCSNSFDSIDSSK